MKRIVPTPASAATVLRILGDLMLGGRHSRRTVAALGVSLPTADRWLKAIEETVPGIRKFRIGKVTWLEWSRKQCEYEAYSVSDEKRIGRTRS